MNNVDTLTDGEKIVFGVTFTKVLRASKNRAYATAQAYWAVMELRAALNDPYNFPNGGLMQEMVSAMVENEPD